MHSVKRFATGLVGFIVAIMLVMFVVHQPANAGHAVSGVFSWLGNASNSFGTFITTATH